MPALSRVVFLGFQAAALLATVGPVLVPLSALATPVPLPMPLMPHIADYAARTPGKTYAGAVPVVLGNNTSLAQHDADAAVGDRTLSASSSGVRRRTDMLATVIAYVEILDDLSTSGNDTASQQQVVAAAIEISDTLRAFKNLLGDQKKGLANFDPNDPLDVLLKNLINAIKNALEAIDILVYRFPVLGPILGPIVYEVKCILDAILDLVENITDGVINALLPDLCAGLRVVISVAVTGYCARPNGSTLEDAWPIYVPSN
ncbi:hypothetical protein LXA43DRAFT_969056 [Ganoderma leucocontextum]|nr:hypothetical protein LXA43DRAFT_969056 [Ganoderma leucocontextum]